MLWKRIVTAAILAPIFLLALFKLPTTGVQVFIGVFFIGAAWEGSLLSGFKEKSFAYIYVAILITLGVLTVMLFPANQVTYLYLIASGLACLWWLMDIVLLSRFSVESPGLYGSVLGRASIVVIVLITSWLALNALLLLDSNSPALLVYVLVMVWVADSGAYFTGKFLGSRKLALHVSPGKTIEGVIGGVIAVLIFAWVCGNKVFQLTDHMLLFWLLISIITTLVSVVGDLNESALKRVSRKKDSGSLFPGHGGFFDRADAITAAIPVFYFGWYFIHRSHFV